MIATSIVIFLFLTSIYAKEAPQTPKYNFPNGILNRRALEQIYGADLTQITQIDLYGSNVNYIEPDTFSGLSNLTRLILWANRLNYIPYGAFNGLTNLVYLDLDSNFLTGVSYYDFRGLRKLQTLDLRNNRISYVDSTFFDNFDCLANFYFENNYCSITLIQLSNNCLKLDDIYCTEYTDGWLTTEELTTAEEISTMTTTRTTTRTTTVPLTSTNNNNFNGLLNRTVLESWLGPNLTQLRSIDLSFRQSKPSIPKHSAI